MPVDKKLMTVNSPAFRASYINIFEPKPNQLKKTAAHPDGEPQFSVTALFKKGEDLKVLQGAVMAAIQDRYGDDQSKWPKKPDGSLALRLPFRLQDEKEKEGVMPAGHEKGAVFCTFSTNVNPRIPPPKVYDQFAKPIGISDQTKVYSGCWLIANVTAGVYPKKGVSGIAPGVKFYLNGAQLFKDDEPISGRPSVETAFAPVDGAGDGAPMAATNLFGSLV